MVQHDCGGTLWMEKVQTCRAVLSECLDLQGNVLLGQSELEMIKGEWSPAGEMRHTDKMYPMMGNHAMAPRGNV